MITNRSRLMGSMIHYFTLIAPKSQVYKIVNCTTIKYFICLLACLCLRFCFRRRLLLHSSDEQVVVVVHDHSEEERRHRGANVLGTSRIFN
jgi:hypothetical protein